MELDQKVDKILSDAKNVCKTWIGRNDMAVTSKHYYVNVQKTRLF